NDAAPLVFGDLGVGDPDLAGQRCVGEPGLAGESAAQGDGEPTPQFRGAGIDQDGAGVVVAVRAQRLPELRVITGVTPAARHETAVWADPATSTGAAAQESAVFLPAGVDRAERWCGERCEHTRVLGHGGGDALAAAQACANHLVDVSAVDLGTGRAL